MTDYLDELPDDERLELEQQLQNAFSDAPEPEDDEPAAEPEIAPEAPHGISPAVRAAVRRAEAAGQASACALSPGQPLPDDLELALERRVECNLATTGGRPVASVAGADPDVVELEAPYRKPRVTTDPDLEQLPSGSLDDNTPEKE